MYLLRSWGLSLLLLFCAVEWSAAQALPKKKQVLARMALANRYFMQKWPDPGLHIVSPDRTRPSNIWTRAVYYEGVMAMYALDKKKEWLDYTILWGEKHKWGLRDGIATRNADNQCCGQTYIDLYKIDPQPQRIKDIKDCIDNMVNSPKKDDWSWIDALQMAMPVFAHLGVMYQDHRYYEKMYDLYLHAKTIHGGNGLYNPEDKLWWRDKDFVAPYQEPNGEDCYWSRGNGWVYAAMVRVLDIMPANAPHQEEYQQMFLDMSGALAKIQRSDGYWNVSLHDPTNFGGPETSGTGLFIYGMAWGINKGLLDRKTYLPIVLKGWKALDAAIHPNGFLGYAQSTGKEPKDGQPVTFDKVPNFEDFGLGCVLLAGSEVCKLKK